ncbi:MAG: hypothetical protein ACP5XB_09535 [Isosphaeraceae bacterium]
MNRVGCLTLSLLAGLSSAIAARQPAAATPSKLTFCCRADNDVYRVITTSGGTYARYGTAAEAVCQAPAGGGVLVLADGYPDKPTAIEPAVFEAAAKKRLRLYVEYPAQLPGMAVGPPTELKDPHLRRASGNERGVVVSSIFGRELPAMRIVSINGCCHVPVRAANPYLVLAKVAGVDTAVFGLSGTPTVPLLFDHPGGGLLVATTGLSRFVSGRFMPADAWRVVWRTILARLQPDAAPLELRWTPTVRPTYGRDEPLPADVELRALRRAAGWVVRAHLLRHAKWPKTALDNALGYDTVRDAPAADWPQGDGAMGVIEGFSSLIRADGGQPTRYAVRVDCTTETAMLMAADAAAGGPPWHAAIATRLLDYIHSGSGLAGGPRADPQSPSYGLLGWALDSPETYWGDDNARSLLATGAAAALLKSARWSEPLARGILANLRTTGVRGLREPSLNEGLLKANGWRKYWNGAPDAPLSPHFEAWPWACYLWAYSQTNFPPLLTRGKAGIETMMRAYPKWQWCLRSGTIERARMLLPLAWLVRVEDTPEHRAWLRRMAGDLLVLQDASGAIREVIGDGGQAVRSNAAYGTGETSLIQANGDPVCDLLYSCNFALIGLHEAAAATGEPFYGQAEDKLAKFLCRVQVRSEEHPELDGAWCRAVNFRRWEYWASNADWEWGPWCVETGWSQPWIAATLALRQRKTSLWDLLGKGYLLEPCRRLRPRMFPDDALGARTGKRLDLPSQLTFLNNEATLG